MKKFAAAVVKFARDEKAAALVEYAILISLIAVICLIVVATFGNKVSEKFSSVAAKL